MGGEAVSAGGSGVGGAPKIDVPLMDPPPDCRRDVSLTAVVIEEPPPFDLIIVADHSDSLSWSREELAAGLTDLLDAVRGRAVRIFLLTPTQYGASSEPAQRPLTGDSVVAWRDPGTGEPYANAMTVYSQTCTDPSGTPIECPGSKGDTAYKAHGVWELAMPPPLAVLTPELDDAAFALEQTRVAQAILALGGSGSPEEQPLCTLARYVSQARAALPSHAVFLILSDEDDKSLPDDCLAAYDSELNITERETSIRPCDADCDAYRYTSRGQVFWTKLPFRCAGFDDLGQPIPGTEMENALNESSLPTCDGFAAGPCSTAEEGRVRALCDSGLELVSCTRECATRETDCRLDRSDASVDLCTSAFSEGGLDYPNLTTYCAARGGTGWNNCTAQGIDRETEQSIVGTYAPRPLVKGTSTADLARYVRSQANTVFGTLNYQVEAIVFDESFACTLNAGQSYATNLISFVGDPERVFSLCGSYAPALEGVWTFAQTLVQTDFQIELKSDEHVTGVTVIALDGTERPLAATAYTVDEATGTLTVDPKAFQTTDSSLRVEVTSECRKIIE